MEANLSYAYFAQRGVGGILIYVYPQYSYALYLDSSMNIKKKDYTHIKNVLDSAIFTYILTGGYIKVKKYRNKAPTFGHKTNFWWIQQPNGSRADGFYLMHHMIDFRRDRQRLRMSSNFGDAHLLSWATSIGSTLDHRMRAEFITSSVNLPR